MKILNFLPNFSWASGVKNGIAKVNIAHESFWIRECQATKVANQDGFKGFVDNQLTSTHAHGLRYNDQVAFVPTLEEEK